MAEATAAPATRPSEAPAAAPPAPALRDDGVREVPFGASTIRRVRSSLSGVLDSGVGLRTHSFPSNSVTTSKYTVLTFLPRNIFEQLQKAANSYFLVLSLLMGLGPWTGLYYSSIFFGSTLWTLAFLMSITGVIAALDDYRRHKSDAQTNSQPAAVFRLSAALRGPTVETAAWADVAVGNVLLVRRDEHLPADVVPLACSGSNGTCYVSTANLDGETNLKIRSAVPATQDKLCAAGSQGAADADAGTDPALLETAATRLSSLQGAARAEAPSKSIHTFTGSLHLGATTVAAREQALSVDNLLLRGTQLRNTAWCIGLVVYTGPDTRMVQNSKKTPSKLANLERVVNRAMLVVIGAQVLLGIISDVLYIVMLQDFVGYWYLFPGGNGDSEVILPEWIAFFITYFILYNNLMPISLYAGMECCNYAMAYFMKHDLEMYDEAQDCPAMVRNTNICHELGQVSYIFSDKTGTLTQNVMDLKRVSLANRTFGHAGPDRGFTGAKDMFAAKLQEPSVAKQADVFLEILSVAHTVVVSQDQQGNTKLEAESPDEGALVEAAQRMGWAFRSRAGSMLMVDVAGAGTLSYDVCAVNAFTSARKRMSVVVRSPSDELLLLVKGADNVMLQRAATQHSDLDAHLTAFAQEGLRTLVLGRRRLENAELFSWLSEYEEARSAMHDRENELAAVAEKLEVQLEIVGATGIEDKLQDCVGETIVRLREAGIKLWVLTGDKLETARNIGFSTRVLSDEMDILVLDVAARTETDALRAQLTEMDARIHRATASGRTAALMVTGASLELVQGGELSESFLRVATQCRVAIAVRVTPLQKAWMVQLVRCNISPTPVTLAIGDGANDVPMIQEAQVGVGVSGKEGRQAVNAADFAICQFRFLQRLLLVHGRLNYRRMSKVVLYSFWKNAVLVLVMFCYSFISGYSSTSMFDDWVRMSFNIVLFLPIVATGVFDRDVDDATAMQHPKLYESGRLGLDLNVVRMVEMLLSAVVHAVLVFAVLILAFDGGHGMHENDFYGFGTAVFTWIVIGMNTRILLVTTTQNLATVVVLVSSYLMYLIFIVVYSRWSSLEPWMTNVDMSMFRSPLFWIGAVAVPSLLITVDSCKAYLLLEFSPDRKGLILERVLPSLGSVSPAPLAQTPYTVPDLSGATESPTQKPETPSSSSFDFSHPEGTVRNHVSLMRASSAEGTRMFGANLATDEDAGQPSGQNRPRGDNFSQQKLAYIQVRHTWRLILSASLTNCVILSILGAAVLAYSGDVVQLRIQYDGELLESESGRFVYRHCPVNNTCTFEVTVPDHMKAPIAVSYDVNPFYQNYFAYMKSVIFDELRGEAVSQSVRESTCDGALTFHGKQAYPCGLPAASVFNDSFELEGLQLDTDDARMTVRGMYDLVGNPPEYPQGAAFSWLWERYPEVIPQPPSTEGAKARPFVAWMLPSFFGHVAKPYGFVSIQLQADQILNVTIHARFQVESIRARKEFVLSTTGFLGRPAHGLGYLLIGGAVLSFCMAIAIGAIRAACPRRAGSARFAALRLGMYDADASP